MKMLSRRIRDQYIRGSMMVSAVAFCLLLALVQECIAFTFQPKRIQQPAPAFAFVTRPQQQLLLQEALHYGLTKHQPHHQSLQSSSSSADQEVISGEAESIYQEICDADGLMTKEDLMQSEFIAELLEDGDLLEEELEEMWTKVTGKKDKIDLGSFVKLYSEIDDLFEDDEEDEPSEVETTAEAEAKVISETDDNTAATDEEEFDQELSAIFKSIASKTGMLTKDALAEWDEVQSLMKEGLLDDAEFDSIWDKLGKADDSSNIDLKGFVQFNSALDELFDFEEDEDEDGDEEVEEEMEEQSLEVIDDADLSPTALFEALSDSKGLVGMHELRRWGELQEMLQEGELMPLELENIYDEIAKAGSTNKLNRDGFVALYDKIDSLFEDEDEEQEATQSTSSASKQQLLATLASLNADEERLPCGLEGTEQEQQIVQDLVSTLESEATNMVREKQGAIEMTDLAGTWELLYTSSSAMAYNKGLSGLGGSFPNGSFGGLKMKLVASKYMTDVEYTEHIKVVPDTASFDVTVNGSWELRSSVSIFTGQPSIVLTVVPDKVTYGPTSTRADHWKSLGPTNMLDLSYLDEDLRIMRGNTSTDSILIFRRTK